MQKMMLGCLRCFGTKIARILQFWSQYLRISLVGPKLLMEITGNLTVGPLLLKKKCLGPKSRLLGPNPNGTVTGGTGFAIFSEKEQTAKQVLKDVDEEKKQIAYKIIGGDLMELYKNMIITMHVETKNGVDFITWTIDYELINADTPHPVPLLNFCIEFTKEVEAHIYG